MSKGKTGLARWVFRAEQAIADRRLRVRTPGKLPAAAPRAAGDTSAPLVCRAVFEEVCVLANGDVVCSCADSVGLRVYGNIRRQPLAEILAGEMFHEIRSWQLESRPDRFCPALGGECPLRVYRATTLDTVAGRLPKVLQLEPTSRCNLTCPACPVTEFSNDPRFASDRSGTLSLAEMISIFEQLPSLEKVLFYNYGEAFVHAEAIPLLRWLRQNRPGLEIHVSSNGIPLTAARVRELVGEHLVDRLLFAIDGARPESYARYRVGGKLERALDAMRQMVAEAEARGVRDRFEIWWQYILFEWNDSDEEIAEAREIAAKIGVPIEWVVTHTAGASKRFFPGSDALAVLVGGDRAFRALSCDLKGAEIVRSGSTEELRHRAAVRPAIETIRAAPGEVILLPVTVVNQGLGPWGDEDRASHRLGVRLLSREGRLLGELPGATVPPGLGPQAKVEHFVELTIPETTGSYHLLLDVVEETVCWFSDRGSSPAVCELEVAPEAEGALHPCDLVEPTMEALVGVDLQVEPSEVHEALARGGIVEDLFVHLRARGLMPLATELDTRARISASLAR